MRRQILAVPDPRYGVSKCRARPWGIRSRAAHYCCDLQVCGLGLGLRSFAVCPS